ncbi:oxidoreductase [Mycena metata]|uniref:Oxidoreductase n=1 Tax=Mycena metata TaxID=1033252 RepID=A0AAD7KIY1_9AGAR|nr:oxidoreductase [Mycena metata]
MSSRVVLVTGCSSGGIGYALQGCRVYATARRLEAMEGLKAHPLVKLNTLDVTSDEDVRRVAGRIDIVVNNAGVMGIVSSPWSTSKRPFDANTYGALRVAQAAFPHMATRRSGLIVNIGSVVGAIAVPWNGLYSATKSAMHMMSDILTMELKPFDIKVMYIAPGATATFKLPETSRYQQYLPNIIQRMNSSQGPNALPAEEFARQVVRRVLQKKPPLYMTLGGNARIFKLFAWLPKGFVLWYCWRLFSRRT